MLLLLAQPERTPDKVPADEPSTPKPTSRWQGWRSRVGTVALILLAVGLLVGGGAELVRTRSALVDPRGEARCRDAIGAREPVQGRQAATYSLSPRTPDQVHQLAFGTSREPEYVLIEFTETGGPHHPSQVNKVLRAQVSEFQRTDGRKFSNPKDQIWAQAIVGTRDTVSLRVCFDPGTGKRTIPGSYLGTVAIDDDSLKEPAVAAVRVTLKYPDMWGPLVLVGVAVLFAIALKAAADATTNGPLAWLVWPSNRAALFYGFAAVAAVYATYLRSEDWGANGLLDVGGLFAAGFAGFLAGLTAHQAGENAGKGENAGQARTSSRAGDTTRPAGQ